MEVDYLQVLSFIFHMIAVINSLDFHGPWFLRVGDGMFDVTLASFITVVVVANDATEVVIAVAFHACTHG